MLGSFLSDPRSALIELLLTLPGIILAVTLHESAHGLMAYKLGDDTAKLSGRISMNPFRHVDLFGLLMLIVFHVGWAKPVNVNVRHFKKPKRDMCLTALAGPVCNLLLSFVMLFAAHLIFLAYAANYMKFGDTTFSTVLEVLTNIFQYAAVINIGLGVFNFIPFPPLDGWKVLGSLLPAKAYFAVMRFERYGMILLIVLLMTGILSTPLNAAVNWVYHIEGDAIVGIISLFR